MIAVPLIDLYFDEHSVLSSHVEIFAHGLSPRESVHVLAQVQLSKTDNIGG